MKIKASKLLIIFILLLSLMAIPVVGFAHDGGHGGHGWHGGHHGWHHGWYHHHGGYWSNGVFISTGYPYYGSNCGYVRGYYTLYGAWVPPHYVCH